MKTYIERDGATVHTHQAQTVTGHNLKNGMHIWVQGHPMTVSNVRIFNSQLGGCNSYVRFTGVLIAHPNNESIMRSSYNCATYGQLAELSYTIFDV